ncbi:MAG: cell envelope integrity protein TolA, partial [Flavobacteriales bacterium]
DAQAKRDADRKAPQEAQAKRDADRKAQQEADAKRDAENKAKEDAEAAKRAQQDEKRQQARDKQALVGKFSGEIQRKITNNWRGASSDSRASARITMDASGRVLSVIITKSSGDPQADAQLKAAIERSSPLPVPDDADVFRDNFRSLTLNFRSE